MPVDPAVIESPTFSWWNGRSPFFIAAQAFRSFAKVASVIP